jgi:cardiolipin synthase A/B
VTAADGSYIPGAASGRYPTRPGNRLRALVGGPEIMRRIGQAIGEARHSVWVTVALYSEEFCFPDGLGSLFDVLDGAVGRGVDVRLLIWRSTPETPPARTFDGLPQHRALLAKRGSRFKIRWDKAAGPFCQHQKSWVIDAGQPSETAFVGGLNVTHLSMARHDVYVEIAGPSATDVRHNFVERWNEASERHAPDGNWACDGTDALPYPELPTLPRGSSIVQIQRMLDASRYAAERVDRSILEQYERAIDAARRTIYIENQAIPMPSVGKPLLRAVERGVEVVMLVPAVPEDYVYKARQDPAQAVRFESIEALARRPNFTMVGITERHDGRRRALYVHAKIMLIDDVWATIGSCNLHPYSLAGNSEMNASIWDGPLVRALRCRLLAQHLDVDTAAMDDRAALRLFKDIASRNRDKMERGGDWQGVAFALSPENYGREQGVKPDLT